MKKKFLLFFATIASLVMLIGCGEREEEYIPQEPELTRVAQEPEEKYEEYYEEEYTSGIHGLLSYVEYNNNRVYIFGSMHLGNPYFFPLADVVEDAMERAEVFVFEIDLNEMMSEEGIMLAMHHMFFPHGESLQTFLPADAYAHFLEVIETFPNVVALFGPMLEMMTPMAISTLLVADIMEELGIYEDYSVDFYVHSFATLYNRQIFGLVSLEQELDALFNVPFDVSLAIIESLVSREEMLAYTYEMQLAQAYFYQDIELLTYILNAETDLEDAYNLHTALIMPQRTAQFASQIDYLLRSTQEPTIFFVTIGIGHLIGIGEDAASVFEVLEDLGHTATPLWNQ